MLGGSAPDEEFEYEGRLSDRVTEEEYTTENLMTVSLAKSFSSLSR